MMYTLILTTVLHTSYFRQSSAVSVVAIPHFTSEAACRSAGHKAPVPSGGKEGYKVEVQWSCVPMGDV